MGWVAKLQHGVELARFIRSGNSPAKLRELGFPDGEKEARLCQALLLIKDYQKESSAFSPSRALLPAMTGCQLPQPVPPPTGSLMRITVSRI